MRAQANGQDTFLELADGRTLAFRTYGAADGFPVLALHGTPGSRFKFVSVHAFALAHGLRVIALDRWGYGATSPHKSPSLSAFCADVKSLVTELGIARLAVIGISGGGPYAAAVSASLGGMLAASALVSPVGPIAVATDPARLSRFHRFAFLTFPKHGWLMRRSFAWFRRKLLLQPRFAMRVIVVRAPKVDRLILADEAIFERLSYSFQVGLALGTTGMETDMRVFSQPWNVDLDATRAPTRIWIGSRDTSVPQAAVESLAQRIPGAEIVRLPDDGHLWIARHYEGVLTWIADTCRVEAR